MGLVIVAPEGKPAETIFTRMSYDEERNQSVVHCKLYLEVVKAKLMCVGRPQTGRSEYPVIVFSRPPPPSPLHPFLHHHNLTFIPALPALTDVITPISSRLTQNAVLFLQDQNHNHHL
jgi:hypothetical protein